MGGFGGEAAKTTHKLGYWAQAHDVASTLVIPHQRHK
jgi:hypothetical protein